MEQYFGIAGDPGEPDLRLRLEIVPHENRPRIPNSLFTTKRLTAEGFSVAEDLIRGHYDPVAREGVLQVKGILTKAHLTRVFEQFLYQAFYSARKAAGYDAFLIHSSGVIRDEDGFLFVGPAESGKSTVAGLSTDRQVVNDEIDLVAFADDGVLLHGTPFNGYFKEKSPGSAPLRAVFLLAQGPEHQLDEVNRSEAVAALTGQIVPPVGLEEEMSAAVPAQMLELADRLSAQVPVRRLTFRPDPGFWTVIDQAFPPAESLQRAR